MNKPKVLSIDFETASTADLKRTGAHTYSEHPSTRVLCMAWAFDNDPVQVWRIGEQFPTTVLTHVSNMGEVRAWNAAFELAIWNNTLLRQIFASVYNRAAFVLSISQVRDTMAQAAYYGLPLSLDMAGHAAGVRHTKDKAGHSLMLRMCRPRGTDPATGAFTWWHQDDPQKFDELCDYCAQDVEVERAVAAVLPDLPQRELRVWQLDQRMNTHGVGVDYDFVDHMKALALHSAANVNRTLAHITRNLPHTVWSVNSTGQMLTQLNLLGYPADNLRKATVAERLDDPACVGLEREILELRADGAKTSAAKLDSMLSASVVRDGVGRVRGMLQYYGAFRTGRWAGRLIQLQNMPRGELPKTMLALAIEAVAKGAPPEYIELLFGPGMKVVSSLLRSCIRAPKDKVLISADSMQIEARVLPWLAGEQKVLNVFRSGGDVYVQAAAGIFGRVFAPGHQFKKEDVPDSERQIGKVSILALGFGGGKGAFQTMAANYGIAVDDDEAEEIKIKWRNDNPKIVQFWWDLDAACRQVLSDPGAKPVVVGDHIKVGMWGPHMVVVLPSGRALFYRDAKLVPSERRQGQTEISYMGVDQYTRKWTRIRTYGGKLAENVTQAVARDVMAEAMLELDDHHRDLVQLILTVHDELLGEADKANEAEALAKVTEIMAKTPAWAGDLPVGADGWSGDRYKK